LHHPISPNIKKRKGISLDKKEEDISKKKVFLSTKVTKKQKAV
jgi:hypothetical protein